LNLDPASILSVAASEPPFESDAADFARALVCGLRAVPKRVPCKYLYDAAGSALFERICDLPEYYPTRTELGLLEHHAGEIARHIGDDAELVEFGAGSGVKVRLLLDALARPRAYVPIDISGPHVRAAAGRLAADYPGLAVRPVVADYTRPLQLPAVAGEARRRVGFFPGSTIGNFAPDEAVRFLLMASSRAERRRAVVGVDLVRIPAVLHAAYNDAAGVTAAFTATFSTARTASSTRISTSTASRITRYPPARAAHRMASVSLDRQHIHVAGERFVFAAAKPLPTEDSYKYTVDCISRARGARGFRARRGMERSAAAVQPALARIAVKGEAGGSPNRSSRSLVGATPSTD